MLARPTKRFSCRSSWDGDHTLTLTHTLTQAQHTYSQTPVHIPTHIHVPSHTHILTPVLTHSIHTHTQIRSVPTQDTRYTYTHSDPHSLVFTLAHSTHSRVLWCTHVHVHTLTCTHACPHLAFTLSAHSQTYTHRLAHPHAHTLGPGWRWSTRPPAAAEHGSAWPPTPPRKETPQP